MQYGYFDNENKEYVITRPDTPTPWMNYIGNGNFSGVISNTGGGLSFDGDPSKRRVTRYKFNGLPKDRPGRYIYIRDEETGEYWSPTWQPVLKDLENYECRHGLGYTTITSTYDNVKTTITYCVPLEKRYELWHVKMENLSDKPKKLKLFSYVEFSWNDAKYDALCSWPSMAFIADFDKNKIVVDTVAEQLTGKPLYDYISTDLPIDGYDCNQENFIGQFNDESNPAVLKSGKCTNSFMHSDTCVGVLSSSIVFDPKQTRSFNYTLGATHDKADIDPQICDAFCEKTINNCIPQIKAKWENYCSNLNVNTPSDEMNTMLNIWNAYQAKTTFDWSRFISLYEYGVDRGFGFRDSMQDVLGVMHAGAGDAKERIKLLLSIQKSDGSARTVYFPATKESVGGGRSDDHLWSVFSVCNYIKETGDSEFINEIVPYVDGGEATVIAHLETGIEFTMSNLGQNGIPDMLKGDWNDSLGHMTENGTVSTESVFVLFQVAHCAYDLIELYKHLKLNDKIKRMQEIYDYCKSKLSTVWDGKWFIRAITHSNEKYGTNYDEYNKMYLNPQSWSVLSRLPCAEQANTAMDSVMKHLYTDKGLRTIDKAYSGFDRSKKGYYLFMEGVRENGGIFFHSNTWAIIALTMLSRGDEAFKCYENMLPIRRNDIADICKTEPYVYSQTMIAPPHDRAGVCVNSWLTGTASWTYLAATQYILGIRPEYDGLEIDPKIPDEWNGFTMVRKCRNTVCNIKVEKSADKGLFVNNEKTEGNIVPWTLFKGQSELNITLKY